jgi:predicted HTH transcriptional regulator
VLEYKASFDKAAIESLVAFVNAQGGRVLVGVSDTVKPVSTRGRYFKRVSSSNHALSSGAKLRYAVG